MKQIGNYCEDICKNYLIDNGYNILEANYHSRFGEIDIIASNEDYLSFVEVKARNINSILKPYEAVTNNKMIKIIKTAYMFMTENDFKLQPRFDICEIYFIYSNQHLKNDNLTDRIKIDNINYIKNAFDLNLFNFDFTL